MPRYGMVIDLLRCIGCQACTVACKAENSSKPGIFWNRVLDEEFGEYPAVRRMFLPRPCMHCKDAPCVEVCPTGASYRREDGIVLVDYNKCVGCKYCIEACPYGARYFNKGKAGYYGSVLTPGEKLGYEEHELGVVEKCTFCVHRIERGLALGLKPGVDHAATPACVNVCVASARYFGDLDDPNSQVSQLIRSRHGIPLLKELNTNPSVCYLWP